VEGAILLDSGTTTARIAEMLPLDCELTVVTNSLPIALTLSVRPNLQVLMTGGRVRSRTLAAVGDWAGDALASVRVDVAFLGANGISAAYGLTTPDQTEAAAKRAMIRAARRPVVVADHSKLGADYFARFGELTRSSSAPVSVISVSIWSRSWKRPACGWCGHDHHPDG